MHEPHGSLSGLSETPIQLRHIIYESNLDCVHEHYAYAIPSLRILIDDRSFAHSQKARAAVFGVDVTPSPIKGNETTARLPEVVPAGNLQ